MICPARKAAITLFIWILVGLPAFNVVMAAQTLGSTEIPPELLAGKLRKRNPAFAISVESVLRKLKGKQEIILIDVRKRDEFEKFRIPGSINIPLFAIRTKAFLKSKSLVLVNEGYNYTQLERECAYLRKSGFRVWLLNGGLYYWRQKVMIKIKGLSSLLSTIKKIGKIPDNKKELNLERGREFKKFTAKQVKSGGLGLKKNTDLTIYLQGFEHPPLDSTGGLIRAMKIKRMPKDNYDVGYFVGEDPRKPAKSKISYAQIALLQSAGYRVPLQGDKGRRVRAWFAARKVFFKKNKQFLIVAPRPFVTASAKKYEIADIDNKIIKRYFDKEFGRT